MRLPSDVTSAHAVVGVLGVLAIAGAASWAGDSLIARHAPVAASVVTEEPVAPVTSSGPKGFVRATVAGREACARWSSDSMARGSTVTLDCDARELALVDLAPISATCGRLVAQDRIDPIARCESAEGSIVYAEHDGAPWMIGRCTCNDITVSFEVPVQ
ncbi:MAG TPA: hypothetical protein VGO00_01325 [Kofleriaceae bacterium]|jgi:hypothetical protein|nr:hypothetical protein [Kofleriaceae bacterium]